MSRFLAVQNPTKACEALVFFRFDGGKQGAKHKADRLFRKYEKNSRTFFKGSSLEIFTLTQQSGKLKLVILVGLGDRQTLTSHQLTRAYRVAAKTIHQHGISHTCFILPDTDMSDAATLFLAVHAAILAQYSFVYFRKEKAKKQIKTVELMTSLSAIFARPIIQEATIIAEEINNARDLGNMPGGDMTPKILAEHAKRDGKAAGFSVTIFDEKKMKALGMGAILGVSRGSAEEARFIICEYKPAKPLNKKPLVFVGKGVTFDTGGLNIKPDMSMYEMHMDMCGGAAVIHAIAAIARLKLPVHVVGLIPSVENMPGNSGYRPGDILKSYSGKTIEVRHTDAEGRIILADALGYAKVFKPEVVIDVATLTGAATVALGQRAAAIFSTEADLQKTLFELGDETGDRTWPLPLWDEYSSDIEGTFGDVMNIGKTRNGGAITAAAFLRAFAPIKKWAHIDIAPTMTTIEEDQLAKGARGAGVHLLVAFAKQYAKKYATKNPPKRG